MSGDGGGNGVGDEAVKEETRRAHDQTTPPPQNPQVTKTGDNKTPTWHFKSDDSSDGAFPPTPNYRPARPPKRPLATKAPLAAKTISPPKMWGRDGADVPLVGIEVHAPHPTGVEVGTVTGVHRRKAGLSTRRTPRSTRWPVACSSPPPKLPKNISKIFTKARGKPPRPQAFGQA